MFELMSGGLLLLLNSFPLLENGELDTLSLGEGDDGGIVRSNDKDVFLASRERVAGGITDSNNVKRARVSLDVNDGSHTASVTSLGDHGDLARLELEDINNLASLDINLDNIIHLDNRIGVADSSAVVSNDVRNLL